MVASVDGNGTSAKGTRAPAAAAADDRERRRQRRAGEQEETRAGKTNAVVVDDDDDSRPPRAPTATTDGADADWRARFEAVSEERDKLKRKLVSGLRLPAERDGRRTHV